MSYAALLAEEISGGLVKPIDDALKWGFNWSYGPFELWQATGYELIRGRMVKDGVPLPGWIKGGSAVL